MSARAPARESPRLARARSRASQAWARARSRVSRASGRARSRASRAWGRAHSRVSRASARARSRACRILDRARSSRAARPGTADEESLMAQKTTKSQSSGARRTKSSSTSKGKASARGGNGSRPAEEAKHSINDADREYRRYVQREEQDRAGPPDVLLDVPELKVDLIHFELDDLDAHVALKAKVLNLVKLNVGLDVHLSRVKLDIKGVQVELVLKARLDHVSAIV